VDENKFLNYITGLPNINYFNDYVKNFKEFFAVMVLNLDNFRVVNNNYGFNVGNELLLKVSKKLLKILKEELIIHIGGDEFIILLREKRQKRQIESLAKRILKELSKPFKVFDVNIDIISGSLGIAFVENSLEEAVKMADDAMRYVKSHGRNNFKIYESNVESLTLKNHEYKKEIIKAVENGEIEVFYQPKYYGDGEIAGAEALIRWFKNEKMVDTKKFLTFATANNLIDRINLYVIESVCESINEWRLKNYKPIRIAINLTENQVVSYSKASEVVEVIKSKNIDSRWLEFEITENMIIENFEKAIVNLNLYKGLGITISLDDFGTGYSSLNYFKKLALDSIKIDREFIESLMFDYKDRIIVKTIIDLSHSFGYSVIAEGVENEYQFEVLKKLGCDAFQGFYFSRPLPKKDFEKLINLRKIRQEVTR